MKQETEFECSDPDQAVKTNLEAISGLDFGGLADEPQCLSDDSCCPGYFCCNNGIQPCEDDSEIFKCERTKEVSIFFVLFLVNGYPIINTNFSSRFYCAIDWCYLCIWWSVRVRHMRKRRM